MQIKVVAVLGKGRTPNRRIPDSGCSPCLSEQQPGSGLQILKANFGGTVLRAQGYLSVAAGQELLQMNRKPHAG